jgi:hypothetical protein
MAEDLEEFKRGILDELGALSDGFPHTFEFRYKQETRNLYFYCAGCKKYLILFEVNQGEGRNAHKLVIEKKRTHLSQHKNEATHAADQLAQPRHQPSKNKRPRSGRGKSTASRSKARKPRSKKKQQRQVRDDSQSEEEGDASESEDDGIQPARGPKPLTTVPEQSREESKVEDE